MLANHVYADKLYRGVLPVITKQQDFLDTDSPVQSATAAADVNGVGLLMRTNRVAWTAAGTVAGTQAAHVATNGTAFEAGTANYNEIADSYASGANAANYLSYSIKLSQLLPHSLASVDKMIYWGESLLLKVSFNSLANLTFNTDNNNPPALSNTTANATTIQAGANVLLSAESDIKIVEQLRMLVESQGLTMQIPFVYFMKQAFTATGAQSVMFRLNQAYGKSLKRIYVINNNTTETSPLNGEISNLAAAKVSSLYTAINSSRIQQEDITCGAGVNKDYYYQKEALKGSAISSSNMYRTNFCWVDDFVYGQSKKYCDTLDVINGNNTSGLDLSNEVIYTYNPTLAANCNVYMFIVCSRTLSLQKKSHYFNVIYYYVFYNIIMTTNKNIFVVMPFSATTYTFSKDIDIPFQVKKIKVVSILCGSFGAAADTAIIRSDLVNGEIIGIFHPDDLAVRCKHPQFKYKDPRVVRGTYTFRISYYSVTAGAEIPMTINPTTADTDYVTLHLEFEE